MVKNEHGYTLVELFAVIIISTVIVIPLLTTLVGNIEINSRMHERRNATSIAEGLVYGFDKLHFDDMQTALNTEIGLGNYFVEINSTKCATVFTNTDPNDSSAALCTYLFNSISGNTTFDSTHLRVFVYNYDLTATALSNLAGDTNLPLDVREEIAKNTASTDGNTDLMRLTIWIQYYEDPLKILVLSGVIINEQY